MMWLKGRGHLDILDMELARLRSDRERLAKWQRWFAWYPVRIGQWDEVRNRSCLVAWLIPVHRRVVPGQSLDSCNRWEYKLRAMPDWPHPGTIHGL